MSAATWYLLCSQVRAVRGLPVLVLIGLACGAWSALADDPVTSNALALAAAVFVAIAPALFAGAHLRELGARRTLLALPGFVLAALASSLLWLGALSLAGAGLLHGATDWPGPTGFAACFAALSALFWFGFLPGLPRLLAAGAIVTWMVAGGISSSVLRLPGAAVWLALASAVGWLAFGAWLWRRFAAMQVFPRTQRQALHLPLALHLRRAERIGTPAGTLLLGMGDAWRDRVLRGVVGLWMIPGAIFVFLLAGGLAPERLTRPALWCLGLGYAFGWFMHLCQVAAKRRRHWWLRVDGGPSIQLRRALAVLRREWWGWGALLLGPLALAALLSGGQAGPLACFLLAWWAALLLQIVVQSRYAGYSRALSVFTLVQWVVLLGVVAYEHVEGDMRPIVWVAVLQALAAVILQGLRHPQHGTGQVSA